VAAPLVRFEPVGDTAFPEEWAPGEYRASMKLFGVLPIGWHAIVISHVPGEGQQGLIEKGYGPALRQWEHQISVLPAEAGGTRYVDHLRFDAGWLTPIAAIIIGQFFKHRHRRMAKLDEQGFPGLPG